MKIIYICLLLMGFSGKPDPLAPGGAGFQHIENAVLKKKTDGAVIVVQPLITGAVGLFREPVGRSEVIVAGRSVVVTHFRHYIGREEIEEIRPENYRILIEKYLVNAPELHEKLGRLGFRYENVPSMIIFYNRHKSDLPMALKYSLEETSGLFMRNDDL